MSVVGFDFGNESCIVAVVRNGRIECERETPAIVRFGDKRRYIGTAGAASTMMNPENSISQIKRLIGKQFSDPELQNDLKSLPFTVTEGPDGYPLIHARYLGEGETFTPVQVFAMMLSKLKEIAQKKLNAAVVDCCIGIPVYFTDLQRRAVLDAATIAGLHPLRLFHETTATALAYGIGYPNALAYEVYKTDFIENDQLNVAFVDIGHASMQVCIARFKKGQLKVLAHSHDSSLGGRDFDEVLFHHFAAKFKVEYKIDVLQNARACLTLRAACEKLKKMLSANPEVPLNIECLMDDKDVRGFIKRDEFEQLSLPILERVKGPLEKALAEAGLSVDDVDTVELVGSGSRVPAVNKILMEFFKKEPKRTMNASECVAKGCAWQCAILSPTFKVREFQVNEIFPFSISLSWKGSGPDAPDGGADNQQSSLVFPKGNSIPSIKALTIRSGTFSIDAQDADVNGLQTPARISTYTIGPFQTTQSESARVKVKVRLNLHGIVSVDLTLLEEEVEVPVSNESARENTKMDTDEATADAAAPPSSNDNDVPETGDKTEVQAPKKKVKKTKVPIAELVYGAMAPVDVQKARKKEFEMALQDRVDVQKAVEAYVYDMRNKVDVVIGFIVVNDNSILLGIISGNTKEVLHRHNIKEVIDLINCYSGEDHYILRRHLREYYHYMEENLLSKTAWLATKYYINEATDQPNITGLILAGPSFFITGLIESDMFNPKLKEKIIKGVDTPDQMEPGLDCAIEDCAELLNHVRFFQEHLFIKKFFGIIFEDRRNYVIGVDASVKALVIGAVKTLIVWENLQVTRYVLRNSTTDDIVIKHYNKEQEANQSNFREYDLLQKVCLLEWFATEHRKFGCTLQFVSNESTLGSRFCKGLEGVGAILRYELELSDEELSDDGGELDLSDDGSLDFFDDDSSDDGGELDSSDGGAPEY